MCAFCESLVRICPIPNTNAIHFCNIFSDIGQCCHPVQKNGLDNPATLGTTRIINGTCSKYSRPLHKLDVAHRVQTTD